VKRKSFNHSTFRPFNRKGFTLTEVMVTLGLLGIIAAITVPAVMNIAPDTNKIMFKKSYSTLEKAIDEMINDESLYPSDTTWTFKQDASTSYTYICDDVNGVPVQCGFHNVVSPTKTSYPNYYDYNKFCTLLTDELNTVGTISCPGVGTHTIGTFTTSDGVSWSLYSQYSDNDNIVAYSTIHEGYCDYSASQEFPLDSTLYTTKITMDVNGSKAPNCSEDGFSNPTVSACAAGKKPDTFQISVRYDGKLNVPSTDSTATSILSNPSNNQK